VPRFAQAGDAGAFVTEQVFGDVPAFVFGVDAHVHRHFHVVEKHLIQMVAAVDRDDRAHRDARRFHIDQ
jgi:hypothetical protein